METLRLFRYNRAHHQPRPWKIAFCTPNNIRWLFRIRPRPLGDLYIPWTSCCGATASLTIASNPAPTAPGFTHLQCRNWLSALKLDRNIRIGKIFGRRPRFHLVAGGRYSDCPAESITVTLMARQPHVLRRRPRIGPHGRNGSNDKQPSQPS